MNNKFFSKEYRHNFLKHSTDPKILNDYFWNIDKLSKKKGGIYSQIYADDIEFVLDLNNNMVGGSFLDFFMDSNTDDKNKNIHKDNDIGTEQCFENIGKTMGSKSNPILICKECTSNKESNTCDQRIGELEIIRDILLKNREEKFKDALERFADILICCHEELFKDNNKIIKKKVVPDIVESVIKLKSEYNKIIYKYLKNIVRNQPDVTPMKFITDYLDATNETSYKELFTKYKAQYKESLLYSSYIIARIYKKHFEYKSIEKKYKEVRDDTKHKLGIK
jgi:hypothetical protein